MPPLWNLGRKSVQKNGLDVGEDLFFGLHLIWAEKRSEDLFFWSSPKFGQKNGLLLSEDLFFGLHYSLISRPPLSKIVRTLVIKMFCFRHSDELFVQIKSRSTLRVKFRGCQRIFSLS